MDTQPPQPADNSDSKKRPSPDETPANDEYPVPSNLPACVTTDETGNLVYCKPCIRWFLSIDAWKQHSGGKKHVANLESQGENGNGEPPIPIPGHYRERAQGKTPNKKKRKICGVRNIDVRSDDVALSVDESESSSEEGFDWPTSDSEDGNSEMKVDLTSMPIHEVCGVYDETGMFVYCRACEQWMLSKKYGHHIKGKNHWEQFNRRTEQNVLLNVPVPELDEELARSFLGSCYYCGPYTVWLCSEHRHSEKHISKVRKFLQKNPEIDSFVKCSCRDDPWGSYKKAIRDIQASIKNPIDCGLCHVSLIRNESDLQNNSTKHRATGITFVKRYPEKFNSVRICNVCCESLPSLEWVNNDDDGDVEVALHIQTQPAVLSTTGLQMCSTCDIEFAKTDWSTHVSSTEHIIRMLSQPQTARCSSCRISIPLRSWSKYETILPLKDWKCSETTRCLGGTVSHVCIGCWVGVSLSDEPSAKIPTMVFHDADSFEKHLSDPDHSENLKRLESRGLKVHRCNECHLDLLPSHEEFHNTSCHRPKTSSTNDNFVCHACDFVGNTKELEVHRESIKHLEKIAELPNNPNLRMQQWCHQCEIFGDKSHWEYPYLAAEGLKDGDPILDAFGRRQFWKAIKQLTDLEEKLKNKLGWKDRDDGEDDFVSDLDDKMLNEGEVDDELPVDSDGSLDGNEEEGELNLDNENHLEENGKVKSEPVLNLLVTTNETKIEDETVPKEPESVIQNDNEEEQKINLGDENHVKENRNIKSEPAHDLMVATNEMKFEQETVPKESESVVQNDKVKKSEDIEAPVIVKSMQTGDTESAIEDADDITHEKLVKEESLSKTEQVDIGKEDKGMIVENDVKDEKIDEGEQLLQDGKEAKEEMEIV